MNLLGIKEAVNWWAYRNWKIRIAIHLLIFIISGIMLFCGYVWILGWGTGILLLLFGGKSQSEKNGYRF